jgi:hypothetical protein
MDDELLSHWIVRTAHANRIKLQTFTTLGLGREAALWNRDIDRSASDELLGLLSAQTGSTVDELRGGLLSAYEGTLFSAHNAFGNTKWILPLGIYHRTRRAFGVQFCPLCLFFDPIPYFRRRWRLALSTICEHHGNMLHDRCPACGSAVVYFRNDLGRRSDYRIGDHASCWQCGFDLRRAPVFSPSGPDGKAIMGLRSLVAFHEMGWWFQGNASIPYGHLYFDALHHVVTFLASTRGRRVFGYIEEQTGWRPATFVQAETQCFERHCVGARHELLVSALWLLDDWPDRFVRAARATGLSQSRVLRGEVLPFWFESEIRLNLGAGFAGPTEEEAKQAAAHLAKGGSKISGAAVGRLLGSRDSVAAKAYSKSKLAPMTEAEFQRTIERLTDEIQKLRPRSPMRLILQRDRTIFRLMRLTGWTEREVLGLTLADAARVASMPKETRSYPKEVAGLLLTYLRDTRRYLAGDRSTDALFICWRGSGIGMKNWGLRGRRAVRRTSCRTPCVLGQ